MSTHCSFFSLSSSHTHSSDGNGGALTDSLFPSQTKMRARPCYENVNKIIPLTLKICFVTPPRQGAAASNSSEP